MFKYKLERILVKDRKEFLEQLNLVGEHGHRVVQILRHASRDAEYEDDENAFFSGEVLIETFIRGDR
jgi:hypothetical protein